ncbi:type II toxin-antitoxin system prevent-host-death family antitoxin [Sporichthya brevicatena]|uniref:type II toxin-antitoxin system Phd/YefM family antitoxin n=1 Tax=Sporichthya brevicatena TaxID=171442 RepID=UPI0031E09C67
MEIPLPDWRAPERPEDVHPLMPPGTYAVDPRGVSTRPHGTVVVNPADAVGLREHDDAMRLSGCCRRDGLDGPNQLCASCGAEVATLQDDCWVDWSTLRFESTAVLHAEATPTTDIHQGEQHMVDVPIAELRADLASWIARAQAGDEVVITEQGTPVARLCPVESASLVERLVRDGVLTPAKNPRTPSKSIRRIQPTPGPPISGLVGEQRR